MLKKVGFDVTLLSESEKLSDTLGELLALSNGDKGQSKLIKDQRDRAFVYLMQAVKEVRRVGQYAFWHNPKRKKGYISNYHK